MFAAIEGAIATLRRSFWGEVLTSVMNSKLFNILSGILIGSWGKQWYEHDRWVFLKVGGACFFAILLYFASKARNKRAKRTRTVFEAKQVMRPDPEAELLMTSESVPRAVVGNVIELFVHPNLNSLETLPKIGWAPNEVSFSRLPTAIRDFRHTLSLCGGVNKHLRPPNSRKFGLHYHSFISFDSHDPPELQFYETDYFTQESVYQAVSADSVLRHDLSRLKPQHNSVPNACGLQAIVVFKTGDVLCMLRAGGVDAEQGRWSISFEEQIKETDFDVSDSSSAERLFRRAFIEEVFGCKNPTISQVLREWEACKEIVYAHRLLGLFFEEKVAHFQLLGLYYLHLSPVELAHQHREATTLGWAGPDSEGSLYILKHDQINLLLVEGVAEVNGLYDGRPQVIRVENLHRTSLYRLWRLRLSMSPRTNRETDNSFITLGLGKK